MHDRIKIVRTLVAGIVDQKIFMPILWDVLKQDIDVTVSVRVLLLVPPSQCVFDFMGNDNRIGPVEDPQNLFAALPAHMRKITESINDVYIVGIVDCLWFRSAGTAQGRVFQQASADRLEQRCFVIILRKQGAEFVNEPAVGPRQTGALACTVSDGKCG